MRRVRVSIVTVQAMSITQPECVCSLRYTAWNAHAPYCYLWPAPLYNTFPQFLVKRHDFAEKVTEHKMCGLILSIILFETFLILRKNDHECILVFM